MGCSSHGFAGQQLAQSLAGQSTNPCMFCDKILLIKSTVIEWMDTLCSQSSHVALCSIVLTLVHWDTCVSGQGLILSCSRCTSNNSKWPAVHLIQVIVMQQSCPLSEPHGWKQESNSPWYQQLVCTAASDACCAENVSRKQVPQFSMDNWVSMHSEVLDDRAEHV